MIRKNKFKRNTKTIYYAFVQKLEVPVEASEKEIDDMVCQSLNEPADYMWSDKPDLFDLDKYC